MLSCTYNFYCIILDFSFWSEIRDTAGIAAIIRSMKYRAQSHLHLGSRYMAQDFGVKNPHHVFRQLQLSTYFVTKATMLIFKNMR